MKVSVNTAFVIVIILFSSSIFAQDIVENLPTGDEIAKRINARNEGTAVSRTLIMELIDRRGKKRLRKTRGFRKYVGKEKRSVIFYLSPKNIKDTAFLTIDYPDAEKEDDQWLYIPAARKVRRISASNRGDYFLGTDFTYEDIKKETKVALSDYKRTTIGEEVIEGHNCYVIDATPVNIKVAKELGYSKVKLWVDSEIWITRKTVMWDVKGNLLKTIYTSNISKVQNIWTVHKMKVENHKTGHQTIFVFNDVDYLSELKDDLFTEQSLRRGF